MQTDPYMVGEEEDSAREDDESDVSASPRRKRPRGSNFGNTEGEGLSAEMQLEQMLVASEGIPGLPAGVPPGGGGKGGSFGAVGGADAEALSGMAKVETTPMDFSRLVQNTQASREMQVPKNLCHTLMTPAHRVMIGEESGADAEWVPEESMVKLRGSTDQVKRAMRLLQRVVMHCHWGRSEAKVARLLKPRIVESTRVRLSPMNTLKGFEKNLTIGNPILAIGKDKNNDLAISDAVISRQHCVLELDMERGAVYAIDCSTNGTYLNDVRLPAKTVGKVLISHGDELLFKDPAGGDREFGYVVTLYELHVKEQTKLVAPRRIMSAEDIPRDFDSMR